MEVAIQNWHRAFYTEGAFIIFIGESEGSPPNVLHILVQLLIIIMIIIKFRYCVMLY